MSDPTDFDENGQWTGTCDDCGTGHDGHAPGTLGAVTRCLRARADAAGATTVLDGLDQLDAKQTARRDEAIRRYFDDNMEGSTP